MMAHAPTKATDDYMNGYNLVLDAIMQPFYTICKNAHYDADAEICSEYGFGFDAKEYKVKNMIDAGIIDPTKVIRCSLENATTNAIILLTTDYLIHDV